MIECGNRRQNGKRWRKKGRKRWRNYAKLRRREEMEEREGNGGKKIRR